MKGLFKMRRIFLAFAVFISLVLAGNLKIVKTNEMRIPGEGKAIEKYIKNIRRLRLFEHFRQNQPRPAKKLITEGKTETQKVLALRVEFVEDNDTLTTGNGKMDLVGFLTPDSGLFYDPPHTKKYFERHLQGLNNYLRANSLGKFSIEYTVKPDGFITSYQLPHEMKFYGDTTSTEGLETGLCLLLRDAIKVADLDSTLNWSDYDHIIIFHAGADLQGDLGNKNNSPFDIASATIPSGALEGYLGEPYILTDGGNRIYTATILPEMTRQDTAYYGGVNILGMTGLAGTLFHEFDHLLGAYDLYDVTGYSMGVGAWSLMGYGAWLGDWSAGAPPGTVPGMLDPYHKILFGWIDPLVINMPRESIPIFGSTMDTSRFNMRGDSLTPIIVKVPITNTEYFLIENRQAIVKKDTLHREVDTLGVDVEDGVIIGIDNNQYDFFLPGSGVLIWHIDEQVISEFGPYNAINIDPQHKGVDLEEGDGIQDFDGWYNFDSYEIYGSKDDPFFIGGYNNEFGPGTNPNSNSYYGKTYIDIKTNTGLDSVMPTSVKFDLFQPGFPKDVGGNIEFLAAKYADLDLDGNNEVIVPATNGEIYAWKSDGSPYIQGTEGLFAPAIADFYSTIAIGDVSGDDKLEVVASAADGIVYVYDNAGYQPILYLTTSDKIRAAPVLADLDGDGKKDIIVGSMDMRIYAWKGDGQPIAGFPKYLGSEIRASVAITDDINPKIVALGTDSRLFLINKDATIDSGFPKDLSISPLLDYSPSVVGDIDRDGKPEIIVIFNSGYDYRLLILDLAGNIKYQSRDLIRKPAYTAPALADIDHDGFLEILVAAKNNIYAFNHNGTLVTNYPFAHDSTYSFTEVAGGYLITTDIDFVYNSSLVIGDINQDGTSDLIIGSPQFGILGFDSHRGKMNDYFPLMTIGPVNAAPLLFDFDHDNDLEIAVGDNNGRFYIWSLPGDTAMVWGQYLHDPANTGRYPDNQLPAMPQLSDSMVKNFYVYPNPAKDEASVRYWLGSDINQVKIRVYDIAGDPVSKEVGGYNHALTDNEVPINLSSIPSGVYLVRLEVSKGTKKQVLLYKLAITR
jgi:M6 family metalloprotease-like protein